MTLEEIFAPTWEGLTTYEMDGTTYYLGVEVRQMVGLSNITVAIGRMLPTPKVSRHNWIKRRITRVNRARRVYLLTYDGVEEMIRNNKNRACREYKRRLDE